MPCTKWIINLYLGCVLSPKLHECKITVVVMKLMTKYGGGGEEREKMSERSKVLADVLAFFCEWLN
jgi:hypothetical protein